MRAPTVRTICVLLGTSPFAPIALADPNVPGFEVETYASLTDPVALSFAPNGDLYVGRDLSGSGGSPGAATRIRRVSAGGSIVEDFGPSIEDPDAVLFDAQGLFAPIAGSVLVGSQNNPPQQGEIRAIAPDESVTLLLGPSTAFVNPSDLVFDGSGRLLFTDHQNQDVKVTTGGTPTTLLAITSRTLNIAYDPITDRVYTSGVDGAIRAHQSDGTPINLTFSIGRGIAVGPGGAFGHDIYSVDNATGELLRTDSAGNTSVMGTGFATVFDLAFGPDGALYASEFDNDRILRVGPRTVPAMTDRALVVAAFLVPGLAIVTLRRRRATAPYVDGY